MRAGIVEQQEWTYRRAVDAVRKESADGKAVSNPMAAVWPHDFCDFSHGSLLEGLAVQPPSFGVSGDHVVQGNSRGNFLQISDTRHGARLHALIMRLIILTGY